MPRRRIRGYQQLAARDGLVTVLLRQYNPDEAEKVGQDGRRVSPGSYRPYVELAQVALARNDPQTAAPSTNRPAPSPPTAHWYCCGWVTPPCWANEAGADAA